MSQVSKGHSLDTVIKQIPSFFHPPHPRYVLTWCVPGPSQERAQCQQDPCQSSYAGASGEAQTHHAGEQGVRGAESRRVSLSEHYGLSPPTSEIIPTKELISLFLDWAMSVLTANQHER